MSIHICVTLLFLFCSHASSLLVQTVGHSREDGQDSVNVTKQGTRLHKKPQAIQSSGTSLLVLTARGANTTALTEMLSLIGNVSIERDMTDKKFFDNLQDGPAEATKVVRRALLEAFGTGDESASTHVVLLDPGRVPNISNVVRSAANKVPKLRVLAVSRSNPVLQALEEDESLVSRTSGGRELLRKTFENMCNGHFVKHVASMAECTYGHRTLYIADEELATDQLGTAAKVAKFLRRDLRQDQLTPEDAATPKSPAGAQNKTALANVSQDAATPKSPAGAQNETVLANVSQGAQNETVLATVSQEYLEPISPCLAQLTAKAPTEVVEECPAFTLPMAESTFVAKVGVDVVEPAPGVNFVAEHANQTTSAVLVLGVERPSSNWFRNLLGTLPGVHVVHGIKECKSAAAMKRNLVKALLSPAESGADPSKVSNLVVFLDPLQLQDQAFILSGISREVPDLRVILFERSDAALEAASELLDLEEHERYPKRFARVFRSTMEDNAMVGYMASFLRPFRVTFEDLQSDTAKAMHRVGNFLLGRGDWDAAGISFPAWRKEEGLGQVAVGAAKAVLLNKNIVGHLTDSSVSALEQVAGNALQHKTS